MRRSLIAFVILACLAIAAAGPSSAQSVSGQVMDEATQAPVGGVAVTLLDSAGAIVSHQSTGDDGGFQLAAPGPGKFRLRFQVPGYRLLVTPFLELLAGEELDYPLSLRAIAPALLDTLIVEGRLVPWNLVGFYERRKHRPGYFATREEWQNLAVIEISDLVRHLNPLLGSRGRGCEGPVYLDGMLMPDSFELNDLFLDYLEAVEVHRSPNVPPEFVPPRSAPLEVRCVIAAWTRLDWVGETVHFDVGAHLGSAVAGAAGGRGRVGAHASLGLKGPIEVYAAFSSIVSALDPGTALARSGWEIIGALRARPLGRATGWYVGVGGRAGGLRATSVAPSTEEQDLVVLSGIELPMGWIRPFVELQVLGPLSPGSAIVTGFVGASARIY